MKLKECNALEGAWTYASERSCMSAGRDCVLAHRPQLEKHTANKYVTGLPIPKKDPLALCEGDVKAFYGTMPVRIHMIARANLPPSYLLNVHF